MAKSEVERIRKEARDEAIKETEAKYKRKVQETLQCVVCLLVPRDGHMTQCQNGHLVCEVCANKNNGNKCPCCRAHMNQLKGNKRIRTLAAEQLIESMNLSFPCKHPPCEVTASKKEIIIHEKKCINRMVPCPDCCNCEIAYYGLLEHLRFGKEADHISYAFSGNTTILTLQNTQLHSKNLRWPSKVLNLSQDTKFLLVTRKVDGIFYSYLQIMGDEEEAKKFKVALSVGRAQSGLVHIGQVFPIDAKREDIIKEKSGVLSFSPIGMGETFFEDIKNEDRKNLRVTYNILDAGEKCTRLSKYLDQGQC